MKHKIQIIGIGKNPPFYGNDEVNVSFVRSNRVDGNYKARHYWIARLLDILEKLPLEIKFLAFSNSMEFMFLFPDTVSENS